MRSVTLWHDFEQYDELLLNCQADLWPVKVTVYFSDPDDIQAIEVESSEIQGYIDKHFSHFKETFYWDIFVIHKTEYPIKQI